jgi:hypothetical protein
MKIIQQRKPPVCGCFSEIDETKLPKYLKNLAKDYQEVIKNS